MGIYADMYLEAELEQCIADAYDRDAASEYDAMMNQEYAKDMNALYFRERSRGWFLALPDPPGASVSKGEGLMVTHSEGCSRRLRVAGVCTCVRLSGERCTRDLPKALADDGHSWSAARCRWCNVEATTAKLEADARALWSYRVFVAHATAHNRGMIYTLDEAETIERAPKLFTELPESVRQDLGICP